MSWISWLAWFFGVSSTVAIITAIALAFLAPSVLTGIMEFLKPWFKLVGEGTANLVRWFGGVLKVAIPDLASPWQTLFVFILSVAIGFGSGYTYKTVSKNCPDVSPDLRVEYKLILRTPAERKAYLKRIGKTELDYFWSKWF